MKQMIKSVTLLALTAYYLSQSLASAGFAAAPKGTIKGAHPQYVSSTSIQITSGYGEANGDWWEITAPVTRSLVGLSSTEGWEYIYIHDSASNYPTPTITNNAVEPVWYDAKQGWYNGFDRCIGVVWRPGGSAVIAAFDCSTDGKYALRPDGSSNVYVKRLISNGNPDGNPTFVEATAYSPVNTLGLFVFATNTDTDSFVQVQAWPWENTNYGQNSMNWGQAVVWFWMPLQRGMSRDLGWRGHDDDDNSFVLDIRGWEIER